MVLEFLIDKQYVCDNTPVDATQNPSDVKMALTDTHCFDLLFVGLPLMTLFADHVYRDGALTPTQAQLFDMVRYYSAYRVYYHLSFNIFKIANAGVTQSPISVDFASLKEMRGQIDARSATLKRHILEFIKQHEDLLPQSAPEKEVPLENDPLDTLGFVYSAPTQRYFY